MLIRALFFLFSIVIYFLLFKYIIKKYKNDNFINWKYILSFYISRLSLGLLITVVIVATLLTGFFVFFISLSSDASILDKFSLLNNEKIFFTLFLAIVLFYFLTQLISCFIMYKLIGKHFGDFVVVVDYKDGKRLFSPDLKTSLIIFSNYFFRNIYFLFIMLPAIITIPMTVSVSLINSLDIIFALIFVCIYIPSSILLSLFISFSNKYDSFSIKTVKLR